MDNPDLKMNFETPDLSNDGQADERGLSNLNDVLCVDKQANVENLRRIFVKMHRLLDLRKEDSELIDLVNHADTLAQQLQDA